MAARVPPPMPPSTPGKSLSSWTRLNVFQRLVLSWDRLHPHNAVQALVLAGEEDPGRWAAAWPRTLAALGLGSLERRGSFLRYARVADADSGAPAGLDPRSLCDLLTEEMNRRFQGDPLMPLRPFLAEDGGRFHAGVAYLHWAADSVSIREVLREWLAQVHDPVRARKGPLHAPKGGYLRYFGPRAPVWRQTGAIRHSIRWLDAIHRLPRFEAERFGDLSVRVSVHEAPPGLAARLKEGARARGATVNDLLVAAVLRGVARHLPLRRTARRPDLAVGTIADLRPFSRRDLSDVFGMFLGYVNQAVAGADLSDDERLITAVARESKEQRRTGRAQQSQVMMGVTLAINRLLPPHRALDWYRSRAPLVGGVSNVNMSATWAASWHPAPLLDYLRVSPVAPPVPFVVSATTLGDRFHLVVSRRPSLVPDAAHAAIVATILDRLSAWSGGSPSASSIRIPSRADGSE